MKIEKIREDYFKAWNLVKDAENCLRRFEIEYSMSIFLAEKEDDLIIEIWRKLRKRLDRRQKYFEYQTILRKQREV